MINCNIIDTIRLHLRTATLDRELSNQLKTVCASPMFERQSVVDLEVVLSLVLCAPNCYGGADSHLLHCPPANKKYWKHASYRL